MKDLQRVEFLNLEEDVQSIVFKDLYQFLPAKGWVWLQRMCFWFLKKSGCQAIDFRTTYRAVKIDFPTLQHAIYQQAHSLSQKFDDLIILMGSDARSKLMAEEDIRPGHAFHFHIDMQLLGQNRNLIVCNMEAYHIPFLSGIVVVPRSHLPEGELECIRAKQLAETHVQSAARLEKTCSEQRDDIKHMQRMIESYQMLLGMR